MTSMYEMVVSCITKPSTERTTEEINNLLPWLRKKSDKFDSLKPEVLNEIIKNCSFSERKRDDIIIRQGDKGDCFYVVLSGKVSIYINTEAVPDNPEDANILVTEDKFKSEGQAKKELDRSRYGNFIAVLDSGKAFGELALINADCIRNASIIADELSHLLIVNRDLYNRSLKEIQTQDLNQRWQFVNKSPLFTNWLSKYKRQVVFSLRKEKFGYNMSLVTQGEPTNGLTFIIKGQTKIVINSNQHSVQYPWLNITNNTDDSRPLELNDLDRNVDIDTKRSIHNSVTKRLPYNEAELRQAQRNIEVCIVTSGEIIGDIEQGFSLPTYASSVITLEPAEVYILDAKNFERLCNAKRNFKTLKILKKQAHYKIKHRSQRSESRPINFYTRLNEIITIEEERESKESELKNQKLESMKSNEKSETLFNQHRGPLIDLYGPGSVFYRNRQIRKEKQNTERKRQITEMTLKGHKEVYPAKTNMTAMLTTEKYDNSDNYSLTEEDINQNSNVNDDISHHKSLKNRMQDWETGSDHLQSLEDRLQNWFLSINVMTNDKKSSSKPIEHYTILKRFKQDSEKKIIPGKKIFLRPKQQPKNQILNIENNPMSQKLNTSSTTMKKLPEPEDSVFEIHARSFKKSITSLPKDSYFVENNDFGKKSKTDVQRNILCHQYTIDEYEQLKQLLKKKEIEMRAFQTAMTI